MRKVEVKATGSSPLARVQAREPAFAGTCLSAEADRQAGNWFAYNVFIYSKQYIFYNRRKSAERHTSAGAQLEIRREDSPFIGEV